MQESIKRLHEIIFEIENLVDEAISLLPEGMEKNRALCYWAPTIKGCLHGGATMTTLLGTIQELEDKRYGGRGSRQSGWD